LRRLTTFARDFVDFDMNIEPDLRQLLHSPRNVAIFSHRNPDGDAIGSALAVQHYLNQLGHTTTVYFPSEYPVEFTPMPGAEDILIWDIHTQECRESLSRKDVFFFLDFNALGRIDKMGEYIKSLPGARILIDHHLYPEPIADYVFSDPAASSTCELVYRFIHAMGDQRLLNPVVGACLYTGIVTDTGSFRHATNPQIFHITAELMQRGMDDTAVQDMVFNSNTEKNLRLLGHCLANRMVVLPEYRTAYIYLTKKDYEAFNIQRGDTEGIVNYLLSIRDVRLAAFIHNQPSIVKLSLRSKGDLDVQAICRKHFNGGGHKNASGAFSNETLEKTIDTFLGLLPVYRDQLVGA